MFDISSVLAKGSFEHGNELGVTIKRWEIL
jgi:hypothetical protein